MTEDELPSLRATLEMHQSGDYASAEVAYRRILEGEPNNVDAQQLLGALLVQLGRAQEALPLLEKVTVGRPDTPQYWVNLGVARSQLGKLEQAAEAYRHALGLDSSYRDARRNLGSVFFKLKRFADAARELEIANAGDTVKRASRILHAMSLLRSQQFEMAVKGFTKLVTEQEDDQRALAGLGQSLMGLKDLQKDTPLLLQAEQTWQRLIAIEPNNTAYYNNLATVLKYLERFDEAERACIRALELTPGFFAALCNQGIILAADGRFPEAKRVLRSAINAAGEAGREQDSSDARLSGLDADAVKQHLCTAYCQLASVTSILGDREAALKEVRSALDVDSENVESRMLEGFLHLQAGRYEQGWPGYEWRRRGEQAPRTFPKPEWHGEPLEGKTVLLHAEQGLGDSFQFVRYARLVKQCGGRVVFLCHAPIAKLVRSCTDVDEVVADGDPFPAYDLHVPLLSLPSVFGTTLETVPAQVPYLFADEQLVNLWAKRLSGVEGFRIGIAWQGNSEFAYDKYRSVPLSAFSPLASLEAVTLFSLQKGEGTEQLQEVDFDVHILDGLDEEAGAFVDTAAVMKNLDLVVSSDTATIHLAGALACPVWLAKSFLAEWRWFDDDRRKTPWYPTMTMFKQLAIGDWNSVFTRMRDELQTMLNQS